MPVYLYAVCATRPRGITRRGGALGEPLRAIACGDVVAIAGDVEARPPLDAPTLRAQEAAVRQLARSVEAILPARFGTLFGDEAALVAAVTERRRALADALALVAGREQMTLRLFVAGGGEPRRAASRPSGRSTVSGTTRGAGTRYLAARRDAQRRACALPEIDWLRPALRRLVRAERVEHHRTAPLVATVHHLITRGRAADYLAAVERASRRERTVRVRASGPWPPWAFASEEIP